MNIKKAISSLTKFEIILWITSIVVIIISYINNQNSILNIITSIIGITGVLFLAKAHVLGPMLFVGFAVMYAVISYYFHYYGETITYLIMDLPISIAAIVSWIRNPYKDTEEVTVNKLNKKQIVILFISSIIVTVVFYFILKTLNTENLLISTISVTTSYIASYLMFFRSRFYGLGYAINDIVIICLWAYAAFKDINYLSMLLCFIMFLINDIYALYNWHIIYNKQKNANYVLQKK